MSLLKLVVLKLDLSVKSVFNELVTLKSNLAPWNDRRAHLENSSDCQSKISLWSNNLACFSISMNNFKTPLLDGRNQTKCNRSGLKGAESQANGWLLCWMCRLWVMWLVAEAVVLVTATGLPEHWLPIGAMRLNREIQIPPERSSLQFSSITESSWTR